MEILLLLAGLGLILAGASFLTDGSAALAKRLRVPEFIIGNVYLCNTCFISHNKF